jgi:outer membrane immunogenic protein
VKAFFLAASAAAIAAIAPAAASAQAMSQPQIYGGLGYSQSNDDVDVGSIQARLGARFGSYVGVEGEYARGVKSDNINVAGANVDVKLRHQEAIYGVGFLPLGPNTDLLARVGYGNTALRAKTAGAVLDDDGESWNFGVGAQHHFDGKNGIRADYTRYEFKGSSAAANVLSLGYTRKF